MKRHHWTDTDKATLRALYPEFSAAECAAAIGCSVSSINNQAHALGLRKSRQGHQRSGADLHQHGQGGDRSPATRWRREQDPRGAGTASGVAGGAVVSDLSHDSPGVQGLAQLGRNAIDHVSELERGIAERDETIRQLRAQLAKAESTVAFEQSNLKHQSQRMAELRTEATKWERLHDELYAEIASEHRRDEYGETEAAAECVRRIVRERDELRAQLDEYERAPTFTYMYRFPHMGGFVWRHSSSDFNGARPVESIELIARPARKGE